MAKLLNIADKTVKKHLELVDVEGVKIDVASAGDVYRFLDAEDRLRVRYPDAEHDWPVETREEAYRFVDRIFQHTP